MNRKKTKKLNLTVDNVCFLINKEKNILLIKNKFSIPVDDECYDVPYSYPIFSFPKY